MDNLSLKKAELDLSKTRTAVLELEYKIEERLADIQRLKDHIKLQEERESELLKVINQLKKQKTED